MAVSACLHCEAEPGDASTMALLATLRKRLLCAQDGSASLAASYIEVRTCCRCRVGKQCKTRWLVCPVRQGCMQLPLARSWPFADPFAEKILARPCKTLAWFGGLQAHGCRLGHPLGNRWLELNDLH